jgi:uncharacterized membrane protein YhdT
MTTILAFSVLLAFGMARDGGGSGLPQWVETYIGIPLALIFVLFVVWIKKRNE